MWWWCMEQTSWSPKEAPMQICMAQSTSSRVTSSTRQGCRTQDELVTTIDLPEVSLWDQSTERERERAKDCLLSDRKVVESFVNQAEQSVMCLVLLDDRRVLRLCVDFTELSTCFNTPSHFIRFQNARCSRQFLPPISMQGDGCQISRSGTPRRWFGQLLSL